MKPRALPIPVRPYPHEANDSFLRRVAAANWLDQGDLALLLTDSGRPLSSRAPLDPDRLAHVASVPSANLVQALPELRATAMNSRQELAGRDKRIACSLCSARAEAVGAVVVWALPQHQVCLRHLRWASDHAGVSDQELDLRGLPEVAAAARYHSKLTRRWGHDAMGEAYRDAVHVQLRWAEQHVHGTARDRRLEVLRPGGDTAVPWGHALLRAAVYPEVVELASMFASTHWRRVVREGRFREFEREATRRVGNLPADFDPGTPRDPLVYWRRQVRSTK